MSESYDRSAGRLASSKNGRNRTNHSKPRSFAAPDPWARGDGYKGRIPAILLPPSHCLIEAGSKGVCVMKPIASAISFAVASLVIQASPILAQSSSSQAQSQTSNTSTLPEFVPSTGRTKYTLAVRENNSTEDAAREAAEALSAKFADITTGSIAKSDDSVAPAPPMPDRQAAQEPPTDPIKPAAQPAEARSIVLAANQPSEEPGTKKPPATRLKEHEAVHKIPRAAVAKETRDRYRVSTRESLAAIGQKVSFFERLTNPALWRWSTQ